MVGFVVTPTTASSFMRRASSPVSSIVRERESIQTDCPRSLSLYKFDSAIAHLPFHHKELSRIPYGTFVSDTVCRAFAVSGHVHHETRARRASARTTTLSGVNPKCSSTVWPGADAPKCSIEIESPSSPTHCLHPSATPASTESRAFTSGGSTSSRYSRGWDSKSSQHGI